VEILLVVCCWGKKQIIERLIIKENASEDAEEGGSYQEYSGTFRFYDVGNHILKFTDGMEISTEMVCGIEIE